MNFYQRMRILPLKKRVICDKCSFRTKQRMFGVFAIDEILRYRWDPSLSMNPVRQFAHFMPPWSVLYQPTIFAPVLSIPMSCLTCVSLWRYLPNVSPNKPSWKVSAMVVFVSKLEVIHKQVEGHLISYNPNFLVWGSWRLSDQIFEYCYVILNYEWWVDGPVTYI